MTEILKGKPVADMIKADMTKKIEDFRAKGIAPKIAIVRLGEDASDISYEKAILKVSANLNIDSEVFNIPRESTTEELLALMDKLNNDKKIHGILVFRPLPKQIDAEKVANFINPYKDIDCMNPMNLEAIFEGKKDSFEPATPRAAVEILGRTGYDYTGKNVVIINRSMVVGKPLAMMLLNENATVTICHSKTKDLKAVCKNADVVFTALGRAKMFDKSYFNEDSIIIDVGVSMDKEGKISGDADYDNLLDYVAKITPVPGGVGSITTTILLNQVLKAVEKQNK
ncbi:bifunctional 5,10-methylenetetrahydrofolate dehydrogenase/5,10-methenyltetrahydrofolate cyclohydrolase [Fenollaria sporofastidiosus]|uniref:bifunctional 5,10-methylenetetrahydrofolate dehydrogenase/5,10-methenyltetrahydrofolate cyclohydrolase n=1 Tax=Fenollaria sporofastidiosus TaxID=2811778 RepID=UPI001C001753|nr:bifunctional 5,10-methylenetetrahydrofolate dehydrogenase/5,10-methenyltetrahydrofolate cyclohydrolase [Fenollaria sporofastidiosus]